MRRHEKEFSIEKMAQVLNVSRSGYYGFLVKEESARAIENEKLKEKIKSIYILFMEAGMKQKVLCKSNSNEGTIRADLQKLPHVVGGNDQNIKFS